MKNKISVISVLYYSKDLVPELVKNVKLFLGEHLEELILVDNSCEGISIQDHDKVKIINMENNTGYGSAINRGASSANADFILIINPDNRIARFDFDLATVQATIFTGIRDSHFYFPEFPKLLIETVKLLTYKTFGIGQSLISKLDKKIMVRKDQEEINWAYGDFMLMSKDTLHQLEGFDENFFLFYEEVDLCQRAKKEGIKVISTKTIEYISIPGKSSSLNVSEIKISSEMASFVTYFRKNSNIFYFKICQYLLKFFFLTGAILSYPLIFNRKFLKMNKIFRIRFSQI